MWLLQCCLLVQVLASRAAYYHELSMTTIQPPAPLHNDSFFGYSIAYHGKSLVASAPRADLDGQVFSCALDTKQCSRMAITMSGTRVDSGKHTHNHNFWLGATVKANENKVFVCAPRRTDYMNLKTGKKFFGTHFGTSGRCYVKDSSPDSDFTVLPQITIEDRNIDRTKTENLTDSFGWSMDIDSKKTLYVGSPALAAGRVMTYSDTSGATNPKILIKPRNKHGFNFGYSIATGNFILDSGSKPGVAVGTPYGDYGVGKVLFYDFQSRFKLEVSDPTDNVGSIFGAALCAANITGPTMWLLVGAPAHFSVDTYHTGVVYVYKYDKSVMKMIREIDGPNKNGAFFGYAIANLGDIDNDKMNEIAIAAPYEDEGRGAVYLYAGSSLASMEKKIKWLQRFQPEKPHFSNLGLSLTANKYSENVCNDLAIGAPGNDRVAVYRCLTVITVNISAIFPILQTRHDKTKFEFDSCLLAEYPPKPNNIKAQFKVRVKITHPNATLTNANPSNGYEEYIETLDKSKSSTVCRKIHVKTSKDGDYEQEIQFDITAELLNDPKLSADYDSSRATVSQRSSLSFSKAVRAAECKKEPCEPKLTVRVATSMKSPYTIGSTETEAIEVVVSNGAGDTAYRPCVRVSVAGDATITSATRCSFLSDQQRICRLQRPLNPDSSWHVSDIKIGLSSLTSKSNQVDIIAEVYNRCEMDKKADDSYPVNIKLTTENSDVRIDSKTDQGEIVRFNKEDVRNGKILYHTYTISNTGGTNWVDLHCDIWLYTKPYITFNTSLQIYNNDAPIKACKVPTTFSGAKFQFASCLIGDLFRKKTITIVIPMATRPGALDEIFKTSNATVETFLRVNFAGKGREKNEITMLTLQTATVPLWIILAAGAVGVLIVLLIAFALYECGFLRRQNKEKLEELQRDVKRKSMILQRQSMRLSDSARAELRNRTYRELLNEAELEESLEAKEDNQEAYKKGKDAKEANAEDGEKLPTSVLNGNSSVSNLDLRAQIEKSLQKQNPKGYHTDKTPLYNENEI